LRRRWKPAAACAVLLLAIPLWGRGRLASDLAERGDPVPVAIVQDESYDLGRLSRSSLSPEALNAKLLVWPEYAFSIPPGQEEPFRRLLSKKLAGSSAVKVLGAAIFPDDLRTGWEQNFAWVLSDRNELVGRYDKLHPIQYVERRLKPNPDPRPVDTTLGKLGIQICYDLDFENGTRRMARDGARILIVPDLDPFEWGDGQHRQHSDMSAARAVESGLWLARAASSGYSQLVDPLGRVRGELGFGKSGVLAGEARLTQPGTVYSRVGWLVGPIALALTALLALSIRRPRA
jgi:apolipoprotein N-acyltransferase